MGTAAELKTEINKLLGGTDSRYLIQLTNHDDKGATTIDDTVYTAACNWALGLFEGRAGVAADTSTPNFWHVSTLFDGVMYFLMRAVGHETNLVDKHERNFFAGVNKIREMAYLPPATSSPLLPSTQLQDSRPDMDRRALPFQSRGRRQARGFVNEINNEP